MKPTRTLTAALAAVCALGAVTACGSNDEEGNSVPSSWIRSNYTAGSPGYVDRSDRPDEVGSEIDEHTSARDRTKDYEGRVFLRYRDDLVAISPDGRGSRIEVDDYRTGYRRWGSSLRGVWPDPDSAGFRGGGPGEGK